MDLLVDKNGNTIKHGDIVTNGMNNYTVYYIPKSNEVEFLLKNSFTSKKYTYSYIESKRIMTGLYYLRCCAIISSTINKSGWTA